MQNHLDGIATLSMYDWPETSAVLDRLWGKIAAELAEICIDAPQVLHHVDAQMPLWTSPDLVVGQTCGWPYVSALRGKVVPFARFDHGLEGCAPGFYRSVFVGRDETCKRYLESAEALALCPKVAMNGADSQSGYRVFAELPGSGSAPAISKEAVMVTGMHRESIKAVAAGEAEIAAIDAVAFELAKRHEADATSKVSILGYSTPKPGLPLITSPANADRAADMFEAVKRGVDQLADADMDALFIKGVLPASDSDYDVFVA